MSELSPQPSDQPSTWILKRILETYLALGLSQADAISRLPAEEDISVLRSTFAKRPPTKILEVGAGPGAFHIALALAFPDARLHLLEAEGPASDGQISTPAAPALPPHAMSPLALSAAVARKMGLDPRMTIWTGMFAALDQSHEPSALTKDKPRLSGPEICSSEGPFDLIVIGGSRSAEARAADLRLAVSALAPEGVVANLGSMGTNGAPARAAVFDLLRYNKDFYYLHAPIREGRGGTGLLRHKSAGWFPGVPHPSPSTGETDTQETREALARLAAATFGDRPVLEISAGAPVLGANFRAIGGATRTVRLATADWEARFFDPLLNQIITALDQMPGAALFSADLCDFASDEFLARLLSRVSERGGCMMVCVTPPGEAGIAGVASRPAARIVDIAASQGLRSYSTASLAADATLAHALSDSTRYAIRLLIAPTPDWRDGAGRPLEELNPVSVARREQAELQRLHANATLTARLQTETRARNEAESTRDALRARLEAFQEASAQEAARKEAMLESLRSECARLSALNLALAAAQSLAEQSLQDERSAFEIKLREEKARSEDLSVRHQIALRTVNDEAERRVHELQSTLAAERSALGAERQARAELEIAAGLDRARLDADLRTERQKALEAIATIDDLKRLISTHEADLGAAGAHLAAVLQDLDAEKAETARLKSDLVLKSDQIESTFRKQQQLEARVQELSAKAAETDDLINLLAEQETQAHERIQALTEDNNKRQREQETLAEELSSLRARLETAEDKDSAGRSALEAELAQAAETGREIRSRLDAANLELIAASCREEDARLALDGLRGHLGVMRAALAHWSHAQETFESGQLSFPETQTPADAGGLPEPGLLPDAIRFLHAEAGDLSMDLVAQLAAIAARMSEIRAEANTLLSAGEAAHQAGLRRAEQDFADRLGLVETELAEVAEVVCANSDVIRSIAGLLDETGEANQRGDEGIRHKAAGEATIRERLLDQGASLGKLREALERRQAAERARTHDRYDLDRSPEPGISSAPQARGPKREGALAAAAAFEPPAKRRSRSGPRDFLRAYLETVRLLDAQRRLRRELAHRGLNPLVFDTLRYQSRYDISPYSDPLRHYLLVGERQGCSPVEGFDPTYYGAHMTDAADWKGSLLLHFLEEGARKGLSPSASLHPISALARESGVSPLEYFFLAQKAGRIAPSSGTRTPGSTMSPEAPASDDSKTGEACPPST
ncbi:MAG: hypothetical protein KGS00_08835 [Alphaproteobacteria bacterium]|nr:hypothetical protein [Alphaproteobacteria bacterium]